jgi:hypothetical protein
MQYGVVMYASLAPRILIEVARETEERISTVAPMRNPAWSPGYIILANHKASGNFSGFSLAPGELT